MAGGVAVLALAASWVSGAAPRGASPSRPGAVARTVPVGAGKPTDGPAARIAPDGARTGGPQIQLPPADAPRGTAASVSVPACRFGDEPALRASLDDWASTIVDTDLALPADYAPPDLVPVTRAGIGGWGLVRSLVIDDLRALADGARAAGNPIAVQSAYRSRSRQAAVFADWVAQHGEAEARRFSARPGHSEHQLGTALDVRAAAGGAPWSGSFGSTAAGRWVAAHAPDYGFVLSYPEGREDVTCYGGEAWHLRYVGRERAAAVAASGLTLREWLYANAGG